MFNNLSQKTSYLKNSLLWNTKGMLSKMKKSIDNNTCIVLYHGIVPGNHTKYNSRQLSINQFISQLKLFKKHFNIEPLHSLPSEEQESDRATLYITFDDGYKNNYDFAAPILDELNIPATFFISTAKAADSHILWTDYLDILSYYINIPIHLNGSTFKKRGREYNNGIISLKNYLKSSPWQTKQEMLDTLNSYTDIFSRKKVLPYWELMDMNEIHSLSGNPLFDVGSHGLQHNNLTSTSDADALYECTTSKKYLENITGRPVDAFAFPDGAYDARTINIARKAGYSKLFIVEGMTREHNVYTRFVINPYLNAKNQYKYILRGSYL
ncbi:MAG: polysaccharide deacetylase family protein [Chitinophagales bacterium]